jgi:hypothetical protein
MPMARDWLDRLFDLNAKMLSTTFPAEAETCRQHITRLLTKHGRTTHDVPELLGIVSKRRAPPSPPPAPPPPPPGDPITVRDLFEGMRAVFAEYLSLEPHEYSVCALWCMHTHVFARFMHTPRLILRSPVRDCGKTTLIDIVAGFVPYPEKSENMTAATFFRVTDRGGDTLLLDEVDNLSLQTDARFRAALNSGYRRGGKIHRVIKGEPVPYNTFAPVVLAVIGTVPLPLARRGLMIELKRDPQAAINRRQFNSEDDEQREMFSLIKAHLSVWAHNCEIALRPPMPEQLTGGQADNWRPLIAVSDACGPEIGQLAREIAVKMCRDLDEDIEVQLLRDIRDLFDRKRIDRLTSAVIVKNLNLLPHGLWSDWRGEKGTDTPRPITPGIVAKLLAPFGVRPVTIWPLRRGPDSKSARGYHRHQFEAAWASYCPETDTPTHSSKIKRIRDR